jgi:hypothetical protein
MSQPPHASGDEARSQRLPRIGQRPRTRKMFEPDAPPSRVTSSERCLRPSKETPVRLGSVSETMTTQAPDITSNG